MKILYVITGLAQGGAERVVCDLADRMYEQGHIVKIAYLVGDVLTMPQYEDIELIKVNLNNLYSIPSAYLKLSKIIREFLPDVIHSHMVHANIFTRLVRLNTPIKKLICTAHNSNEGGWIRMQSYRFTHKLADLTTNVSKEASQAFIDKKAVPNENIETIYNGINLNEFYYRSEAREKILNELKLDKDIYLILAVGRFNEQKDYPNLLKALEVLKNKGLKKIKLMIAGDGELRMKIENLICELNLVDNVRLLGRRNDIPDLMSAADLFVLPSKYEGFGLVVAEAMACETLVVATDCGGVAEVLNNPEFLVEPTNPIEMAEKIEYTMQLAEDSKKRIILKNLNQVCDNFSLSEITKEWIKLYHD